jgi:hypothetical protein
VALDQTAAMNGRRWRAIQAGTVAIVPPALLLIIGTSFLWAFKGLRG